MAIQTLRNLGTGECLNADTMPASFARLVDSTPPDPRIKIASPESPYQEPLVVAAAFNAMDAARHYVPVNGAAREDISVPQPETTFNKTLAIAGLKWIKKQFRTDREAKLNGNSLLNQSTHTLGILQLPEAIPERPKPVTDPTTIEIYPQDETAKIIARVKEDRPDIDFILAASIFADIKPVLNAENRLEFATAADYQTEIDELATRVISDPGLFTNLAHFMDLAYFKASPSCKYIVSKSASRVMRNVSDALVAKSSQPLAPQALDAWLDVSERFPEGLGIDEAFDRYVERDESLASEDCAAIATLSMGMRYLPKALAATITPTKSPYEIMDYLYYFGRKGLVQNPPNIRTRFTASVFAYFFRESPLGADFLKAAPLFHPDKSSRFKATDLSLALTELGVNFLDTPPSERQSDNRTSLKQLLKLPPDYYTDEKFVVARISSRAIEAMKFSDKTASTQLIGSICRRLGFGNHEDQPQPQS